MKLRLLTTTDAWQELQPQWNVLLRRSEADSIFLSWEWLSAWWAAYGAGRDLRVIAGCEGDQLVGVAPLYVETEIRWGARWRCLHFIGQGSSDSDYLSFIVQHGRELEFVTAVLEQLSADRCDWDVVEFDGPLQESRVAAALRQAAPRLGFEVAEDTLPCTTLPLPARWEDYLQVLKPRQRTKVRSVISFFEKQESEIATCASPQEIGFWLSTMFDLHTKRWQSIGQPGVFGDAAKRRFYERISHSSMQNGWLAFHRLSWCGRPLAMQYGFKYGNRFYLLQEGYDPDFDDIRPGVALRGALIRQWIADGLEEYDFLGGQNRYKFEWGGQQKNSVRFRIAAKPASQVAYIHVPNAIAETKEELRKIVPEPLLSWRQSRLHRKREPRAVVIHQAPGPNIAIRTACALYGMKSVRRLAGSFVERFQVASSGGKWSVVRRNHATCMILQFHRVNDDEDPFMPATPIAVFREQMAFVAKHFRVVGMEDIASGAAFDSKAGFSIAVTFDDGYRDNFVHAFPILKELAIPATIYLTTGYIERGQLPWYDQVRLAFKLTTVQRVSFADMGGPARSLDSRLARVSLSADTLAWLRGMENAPRKRSMAVVYDALRVPDGINLPKPMLSWDEIREMQKSGVTFGAHTIWHPVLSSLSLEELRTEIGGSKRAIEQRLQQPVLHFAYPFGKIVDNGHRARTVIEESGFRTAVTTEWGVNTRSQDPLELRRCIPSEDRHTGLFALKLDWNRLQATDETGAQAAMRVPKPSDVRIEISAGIAEERDRQ